MEHFYVLVIVIMIVILLVLQQPKRLDTNAYGFHQPDPSLVKAVARERRVWNNLSKARCNNCPCCPSSPRRKRCGPSPRPQSPVVVRSKPIVRVRHVHSMAPEDISVVPPTRTHNHHENTDNIINHLPLPPPPPMPAVLALPPPSTLIATIPKPVKKKKPVVMVCQGKYCPYKLGVSSDSHYSNPGGPYIRN